MDKEIKIVLKFRKKDFEEIYFKNNNGNYFKDPIIKKKFKAFVISSVILIPFIFFSIYKNEHGLAFFVSIIFGSIIYSYFNQAYSIMKWRKNINLYLEELGTYDRHTLVFTNNFFKIIQDGNETYEKWSNFKSIKIFEDYVTLEGKENYFIPSKSMSKHEYLKVRELISEKIK